MDSFGFAKLPKGFAVLRVFFNHLFCKEDLHDNPNPRTLATKSAVQNAAKETVRDIKAVWRHHFGLKLVDGQTEASGQVDKSNIMIINDDKIVKKIVNLYNEWKTLEELSRRTDRASRNVEKKNNIPKHKILSQIFLKFPLGF